jgi:hypothetical protein
MGTWGHGNFDSDTAADHLSDSTERLVAEIRAAMDGPEVELEADEYWGVAVPCNVELLAMIAEQGWVGVMLPDEPTVLGWKQRFLAIWDASIDGLGPSAGHREARRACLVATWDRLIAQVREQG